MWRSVLPSSTDCCKHQNNSWWAAVFNTLPSEVVRSRSFFSAVLLGYDPRVTQH